MPQDTEFLHQIPSLNELDRYEMRAERDRRERMRLHAIWNNFTISDETSDRIEFPTQTEPFSFGPHGTHVRLFHSRIYISQNLIDQIPLQLMPRIMNDSATLAQIPNTQHTPSSLTLQNLCGTWELTEAMFAWSDMVYRCYGCSRRERIHGSPTQTAH